MSEFKVLTKEKLREVRSLIDSEGRWTQGEPFETRQGVACYCLGGAFAKAYYDEPWFMYERDKMFPLLEEFVRATDGAIKFNTIVTIDGTHFTDWITTTHTFNDYHDHGEVIAVIDKVLAKFDEQD